MGDCYADDWNLLCDDTSDGKKREVEAATNDASKLPLVAASGSAVHLKQVGPATPSPDRARTNPRWRTPRGVPNDVPSPMPISLRSEH